jgi:hypothetical protein
LRVCVYLIPLCRCCILHVLRLKAGKCGTASDSGGRKSRFDATTRGWNDRGLGRRR